MGSLKDFAVNGSLVIKKEKILWLNGFLKGSCPPYLAHVTIHAWHETLVIVFSGLFFC